MPPETTDAARVDFEQEEEQREEEQQQETAAQARSNSDQLNEAAPEAPPVPPAGESIAQRLGQLSERLKGSEKGGISLRGNSDLFNAVSSGIDAVLAYLRVNLTDDKEQNQKLFWGMVNAYVGLMNACDAYVMGRNPWTSNGKTRKEIVGEIGAQARKDVEALRESGDRISTLSPQDRTGTLLEALGRARRRTLELSTKSERELPHVGGAVSHIAVLQEEDLKGGNASGYFKEEDIFTMEWGAFGSDTEEERKSADPKLLEVMRRRVPISDENYQSIKAVLESGAGLNALVTQPEFSTDIDYYRFVLELRKARNAQINTKNHVNDVEFLNVALGKGETFKLSDRNVATSRVANMLGIGDLVAQSETAVLKDTDETERKGNLMQKARGIEALELTKDQMRKEFTEKYKENKGTAPTSLRGLSDKVTPAFMKSVTSLQVLDNLVGQVDRHTGNYMIDTDESGKLNQVQGIDNDFAFGKTDMIGDNRGRFGNFGISILNRQGEINLPHMDSALANRILALQEREVTLMLADVLEPWAIEAFWGRVKTAQDAIRRDLKRDPASKRYLKNDEDWNSEVLQDFRNDKYVNGQGHETKLPTSYLGSFLDQTEGFDNGSPVAPVTEFLKRELLDREDQQKIERIWGKLCALPRDKAISYLESYFGGNPIEWAAVMHIRNGGEMNGDPEVTERPEYSSLFAEFLKIKSMEAEIDELSQSA